VMSPKRQKWTVHKQIPGNVRLPAHDPEFVLVRVGKGVAFNPQNWI
jgi:hypothetical protein